LDEAGLAKDAEVVGHARLGAAAVECCARRLTPCEQASNDFQPHRIAMRVEHLLEPHLGNFWMPH